ncbi:MAG: hypothetical protein Fues2KO_45970 [Fuerstiella sp.]
MRPRSRFAAILALTVTGMVLQSSLVEAGSRRSEKKKVRPVVKTTYDASFEQVELFKGMEEGKVEAKVVCNGPHQGYVVVENATDQPVTVKMPQSFVAVPTAVLKQFGGGLGGGGMMGGGGLGGGGLGGGGMGGGQQNTGGGLGQGGGGQFGGGGGQFGGAGGGGMGQGFFSIPPEKAIKLPYVSACLNHGKADPHPRTSYSIVSVDAYTNDPVLKELIAMVATGRLAPQAAQAAVWTRTDNLSLQQLATKFSYNSIGQKVPYFSQRELLSAQQIVTTAIGRIKERGESPVVETKPVRTSVR